MAFAKLSGTLLASNDAPPERAPVETGLAPGAAPTPTGEEARLSADQGVNGKAIPTAVELAQLYQELRDCIRTDDQAGVRRIFGELDRAGRPLADILEMMKSLVRVEGEEGQKSGSFLNSPTQHSPPAGLTESTPYLIYPAPDGVAEPRLVTDALVEQNAASVSRQRIPGPISQTSSSASGSPAVALAVVPERSDVAATVENGAPASGSTDIGLILNAVRADGNRVPRRLPVAWAGASIVALLVTAGLGILLATQQAGEIVGAANTSLMEKAPTRPHDRSVPGAVDGERAVATTVTAPNSAGPRLEIAATIPVQGPAVSESPVADPPQAKASLGDRKLPDKLAPIVMPGVGDAVPLAAAAKPSAVADGASDDRPAAKAALASLGIAGKGAPILLAPAPDQAAPSETAPAVAARDALPPNSQSDSAEKASPLLEQGDRLFGMGDIASARLFYERAADAGNGQAALRLGETYDPAFLKAIQRRSIQGDIALAVSWYRRARELGASEADLLLKNMQTE